MTGKIMDLDITAYLHTDEDVAGYLAAAFETGELKDVTHALATIARAKGMTETAKAAGLAGGSLYKAVGEGANPTLSTLLQVMDAFNLTLTAKPKLAGVG